ncbi:sidestep VIII isoform X3 [Haematobia irritans]|uniref:sidestep VIII isoform X3 n=1 Tax=Haematobia irritans TaxID=7368 RepID=UPI003F50867E
MDLHTINDNLPLQRLCTTSEASLSTSSSSSTSSAKVIALTAGSISPVTTAFHSRSALSSSSSSSTFSSLLSSIVCWLFIVLICCTTHTTSTRARVTPTAMTRNIEEENVKFLLQGPPVVAESILGTHARLPCNVTPPLLDDRVALVIWYKVGLKTPIYSVDTRESNFSHGTHWSDEAYRERLSFALDGRTGTLTMTNAQQEDTGEYRCRVDFQKSPTRNSKVNLTVIIPPESIIILDHKGTTIKDHILGPYNEGSIINITCVAIGGTPQPRVTWWHENTLLDGSSHPLSDRRVGNILSLGKLKRKNLHMQLTCVAANNNITVPITNTVTLDMNLRPLFVKLQGENRPLSADNSYQLSCVVTGSRPAPTITWWKGSTPMKNTHEIANPDGNMTTSILTFTPTIDDRGKYLSCRAEQSMIPESGMEDGWKLDIYHIPVVSLELGTNSMNSTLREGIDVFFECNIKSNPWVSKVSWRHNGNILENNIAEGIIVANQSLVLQNVSRARSGIYTCVGNNREGDGESNPVHLDIRFAPVCRQGQRTVYSTGRHEMAKIACEIEANPAEANYVWKFNATLGETIDIPASLIAVDRGRSIAHYTPMTENDYGTLLCWASNEIGDQTEPCVYTVTPAGEPDPLVNCTLLNQTSTGFQIECLEGFDGGLQQDFIMEVYVNGTTRHPKIYKSKTPYFEVRGLIPGAGYNVFLVAHNSKGRSNATILQVYTLKDPEKQTDLSLAYAPVIEDIRPFLGILVGIVVSIILVAFIIVIIVRMRGSSGRDRNNYMHGTATAQGRNNNGLGSLHNSHDMHNGRGNCHVTSSIDSIDKNPDIIPQDGHDEDDEWTTSAHNHAFATAALAEQNAVITSSTTYDHIIPTYAVVDKKSQAQHLQQLQQQQQHQQQTQQMSVQPPPSHHGQYVQYNTLIPASKMGAFTAAQQQQQHQQLNKNDLSHGDMGLGSAGQQRMAPYCSATLGRPRQTDLKRAEPNIYSQIDLAHHPMYSTSPMFATNTITGVTMSHPSQLATFTTPHSIYAHKIVSAAQQPPSLTQSHHSAMSQHSAAAVAAAVANSHANNGLGSICNVGGGSGSGGGGGLLQTSGGMMPIHMPPVSHHNTQQQSIICASQKRPQSPLAQSSSAAAAAAASAAAATSTGLTCTSSALSSSGTSQGPSNVVAGILHLQGNGSIVGVNSMATAGVFTNDASSNSGLLKTVPEEIVHHQLNGESIILTQDRSNGTRF